MNLIKINKTPMTGEGEWRQQRQRELMDLAVMVSDQGLFQKISQRVGGGGGGKTEHRESLGGGGGGGGAAIE